MSGASHTAVDRGRSHVAGGVHHGGQSLCSQAQKALKGEGYEGVHDHAQQTGIKNSFERVGLGVFQFRRVADRGFKSIGGPRRQEHAAGEHGNSGHVPGAVDHAADAVMRQGQERKEIGPDDIARDDGYDTDENQGNHRRDPQNFGGVGRTQNAPVLDGFHGKHQHRAQQKYGIDAQAQARPHPSQVDQGDMPGIDQRLGREQGIQYVAGGKRGAGCLHGRPGEPVTPHRDGCDDLAVPHPGDGSVHRSAAGFVGKPGDFRVGKGLDESQSNGRRPNHPRQFPHRRRDGADRKQHQRGTPLATQKAPVQSIPRSSPPVVSLGGVAVLSTLEMTA